MSRYGKEIGFGVLVMLITGLAIYYYLTQVQSRQLSANANWHNYVADTPYALLNINRPSILSGIFFSDTGTKDIFLKYLPVLAIEIVTNKKLASPLFVSFHANGEVFYTKVNPQQFNKFKKEVLNSYFKFYPPETETIETILVDFYPVTGNQFFGSFYHQGIWVGSFSRKLLEESIQHITNPLQVSKGFDTGVDPNSPLNLFLLPDSVKHYDTKDSIANQIAWGEWIAADIFINEQAICFFTQAPEMPVNDSIHTSYLKAINLYLSKITGLTVGGELSFSKNSIYYSACLPLLSCKDQ